MEGITPPRVSGRPIPAKSGRGGSRPGAGAKELPDDKTKKPHTVYATDAEWEALKPHLPPPKRGSKQKTNKPAQSQ